MVNLQQLNLQSNNIANITSFPDLVNLQQLNLQHNKIANITSLAELTNLQHLNLRANNISDITPLSGLTHLKKIYLSNNQIVDLKPLVHNPGFANENPAPGHSRAVILAVGNNPLSDFSRNVYIPALKARGVIVKH